MRRFLVILFMAGALTRSASAIVPQPVIEIANSSFTVTMVSVSSSVATQVDPAATVMLGRRVIEVQNVHASANLWCGHSAGTISTTTGHKITPGASWVLSMSDTAATGIGSVVTSLTIYCMNDSGSGNTNASVTQLKSL